nr:hypothetical protein [uncultured Halomonas sp.]
MNKFLALLTLPFALQACSSMDYRPKVSVADQDAVIEAIRKDNAEMAMYLETLQAQHAQDSGLFESVFNLAVAGAAFANPASGVTSGVSVLLALSGMQSLNANPERPITIVYQGRETPEERSPIAALMAYRQAIDELSEFDGDLAQILLAHYASESGMPGPHAVLAEGPASPADPQGMCMGLATLGGQTETVYASVKVPERSTRTIYDSLKVPTSLANTAPLQDLDPTDAKPLQASL